MPQPAVSDPIEEELNKFEGTWQPILVVEDGKKVDEQERKKAAWVQDAEGNFKTLFEGKVVGQGTQKEVDPTSTPKTIAGEDTQGKYHGIYRFGGEMLLERCTGPADGPRPTEFVSQPGSGHVYEVWKRVAEVKVAAGRPSAQRVVRRAQVLALVTFRASLEQFP